MLLYHAFGFDSSTLDLWLLIGFVEVVGCREALIFVLIWLCFADIVLSAEHILIFSLKGLLLTIGVNLLCLAACLSFSFYLKADYLRNLFEYSLIGTIILLLPSHGSVLKSLLVVFVALGLWFFRTVSVL